MGKLDEIRALGRSQIGRMEAKQLGLAAPEPRRSIAIAQHAVTAVTRSEKAVRSEINKGTPANKGTGKRGRPASTLSKAERQKLYRASKAKGPANG